MQSLDTYLLTAWLRLIVDGRKPLVHRSFCFVTLCDLPAKVRAMRGLMIVACGASGMMVVSAASGGAKRSREQSDRGSKANAEHCERRSEPGDERGGWYCSMQTVCLHCRILPPTQPDGGWVGGEKLQCRHLSHMEYPPSAEERYAPLNFRRVGSTNQRAKIRKVALTAFIAIILK